MVAKLDTFFTQLNAGRKQPYDWAGNEPSLGIPWEYDYAGAPWRTQAVVRRIVTTLYGPTPNGEPGNDDLGAMSSWYVWAALGLYPETPGRGELVFGSPLFPHVTVTLGSGHTLVLSAPGASPTTPYVQGLGVTGLGGVNAGCGTAPASGPSPATATAAYTCPWLPSTVAETGGQLDFTLGPAPEMSWGASPVDAPPSFPAA